MIGGSFDVVDEGIYYIDRMAEEPGTFVSDRPGGETRLRVWWRGSDDWRVDRLLETGEVDLFHQGARTTEWDYERGEARESTDPEIRLPRDTRAARWVQTYADAKPSEPVVLVDSYGLLSLALYRESAAAALGLRAGSALTLVPPHTSPLTVRAEN